MHTQFPFLPQCLFMEEFSKMSLGKKISRMFQFQSLTKPPTCIRKVYRQSKALNINSSTWDAEKVEEKMANKMATGDGSKTKKKNGPNKVT